MIISQHICKKQNLGINDNLFGGDMLAWLDEAGYILACQIAQRKRMVTYKIMEHEFVHPVKEGDVVQIEGTVIKLGAHSVTVKLQASVFCPDTSKTHKVTETTIIYVAVGADGQKEEISHYTALNLQLMAYIQRVDNFKTLTPADRHCNAIELLHGLRELEKGYSKKLIPIPVLLITLKKKLLEEELGIDN